MIEFFTLFTGFGILASIIVTLLFLGMIIEESLGATIFLILLLLFFPFTGNQAFVSDINWLYTLASTPVYLVIGYVWSRYKWKNKVQKLVALFKRKYTASEYKDEGLEARDKALKSIVYHAKSKSQYAFWIIAWPASVLNFLFSDMIINLVGKLSKYYDKITDSVIDSEMKK
jgi:hypothetical protein